MGAVSELFIRVLGQVDASLQTSAEKASTAIEDLGTSAEQAGTKADQAGKRIDNAGRSIDDAGSKSETSSDRVNRFSDAMGKVVGTATAVGVGASAFAAGVALIGQRAVSAAAQMETFLAKLTTVQGSSTVAAETLRSATMFAAQTPFDVEGIVQATVQLEVFGARSKEVLPLVADLAAGMGVSIQEAALVSGKAWSGSLEGFESLRNTYGLSIGELKRLGGAVDDQGQIMSRTTGQIEQNRRAFASWVQANFAGAVARQADTFAGKLSNLGDSINMLFVGIGETLLPLARSVVEFGTSVVQAFSSMPGWLQTTVTYLGLAAGAMATVVAGGAFLVAGIGQIAIGAAGLAVAFGTLSSVVPGLAAGFVSLGSSIAGIALNPFNIAVLGLVAAAGAAYIAIQRWEDASRKKMSQLADEDRLVKRAADRYAEYTAAVNAAGAARGVRAPSGRMEPEQQGAAFAGAIGQIPNIELSDAMRSRGMSPEDVRAKTKADRDAADRYKDLLRQMRAEQLKLARGEASTFSEKSQLGEYFGGTTASAEQLRAAIQDVTLSWETMEGVALRGEAIVTQVLDPMAEAFREIGERARGLRDYLDLTDATATVAGYTNAIAAVTAEADRARAALADQGFNSDAQMLEYLRTGSNAEAKGAIKDYFGLRQDARKMGSAQRNLQIGNVRDDLADREASGQATIEDRVRAQERIAAIARGDVELERTANRDLAKVRQEAEQQRRQTFAEQQQDAEAYISRLRQSNRATIEEEMAANDRRLAQIREFQAQEAAALASPANRAEARRWRQEVATLEARQYQLRRDAQARNLGDMQRQEQRFNDAIAQGRERSTEQQIRDAETIRNYYSAGIRSGSIGDNAGAQKVEELDRQIAALRKKASDEQIQREQNLRGVRQQVLESEMEGLRRQAAMGQDVHERLLANLNEQLRLKLSNIDAASRRELEVEGLTQAQVTAIHVRAGAQRLEALRAQRDALQAMLEQQNAGLREIETRAQAIKDALQEKPAGDSSVASIATMPAFGADAGRAARADAAQTVERVLSSGARASASDMNELRSALAKFGLALTQDATLRGQRDRDGNVLSSVEDIRKQLGIESQQNTEAIRSAITELDGQIASLESAITEGLRGQIGNLSTAIDRLSASVAGMGSEKKGGGGPAEQPTAPPKTGKEPFRYAEGTTLRRTPGTGARTQEQVIEAFRSDASNYLRPNSPQYILESGFTAPSMRPRVDTAPQGGTAAQAATSTSQGRAAQTSAGETTINIGDLGFPPAPTVRDAAVALAKAVQAQVSTTAYGGAG